MNEVPRIRLDSSAPGAAWTCAPGTAAMTLRCDAVSGQCDLRDLQGNNRIVRTWRDPLAALDWMPRHLNELHRKGYTNARWIGYLGYDLGRKFETLPVRDPGAHPLIAFSLHHATKGNLKSQIPNSRQAESKGEETFQRSTLNAQLPTSNFTRPAYLDAVRAVIDYIRAGDVFQVNLSQRFTARLREHPSAIYDRLQRQSPALYGAYLDFCDHALICNSPELFLRVRRDDATGRRFVTTRPIKGTRPRADGMEDQLRDSLKDQAELNMIIDLERNDLGRVCEIGSVRVTQPRTIETHPTVYHGVATIEGTLREEVGFVDLLRATFPGGSITGAPKIRAMQIIDELEPTPRGPYCGAIGYLAADGSMQFNIAIRTLIVAEGMVHIPVGGGIVADSDPAAEYEETLVKASALFAAMGIPMPQVK